MRLAGFGSTNEDRPGSTLAADALAEPEHWRELEARRVGALGRCGRPSRRERRRELRKRARRVASRGMELAGGFETPPWFTWREDGGALVHFARRVEARIEDAREALGELVERLRRRRDR